MWDSLSNATYIDPDMNRFFEDLAAVYRAEIAALAEAGVGLFLYCIPTRAESYKSANMSN